MEAIGREAPCVFAALSRSVGVSRSQDIRQRPGRGRRRQPWSTQPTGGVPGGRPLSGVDYTVLWGWVRPLAAVAADDRQAPGAQLDLEPIV